MNLRLSGADSSQTMKPDRMPLRTLGAIDQRLFETFQNPRTVIDNVGTLRRNHCRTTASIQRRCCA